MVHTSWLLITLLSAPRGADYPILSAWITPHYDLIKGLHLMDYEVIMASC